MTAQEAQLGYQEGYLTGKKWSILFVKKFSSSSIFLYLIKADLCVFPLHQKTEATFIHPVIFEKNTLEVRIGVKTR